MRSMLCGALAGAFLALVNVAAFAGESGMDGRDNLLTIAGDRTLNVASIAIDGSRNALTIVQETPVGATLANRIQVSITGDLNGGAAGTTPAPLIAALPWGSLTQTGEDNAIDASLTGSGNLLAAVQSGQSNTLMASISGLGNQAAISQAGTSNVASFSQVGNGNMVSITQTSW